MSEDIIPKLKKIYSEGGNILEYVKNQFNIEKNNTFGIEISYDLQAGSYIKKYSDNLNYENTRAENFAKIINELGNAKYLLEVGAGEATTLANIIPRLTYKPAISSGFDLSLSRMLFAQKHIENNDLNSVNLFVADMFNCPIKDDSIDLVYSNHSLEPNGGREELLLKELYRISRKYIVLFEPMYEFASSSQKKHMEKHGYVKGLYETAKKLGYKIIEYKLLYKENRSVLNNTGLILIEKDFDEVKEDYLKYPFACPVSKSSLIEVDDGLYSKESMLLYPRIKKLPCLRSGNAIIATKYLDI